MLMPLPFDLLIFDLDGTLIDYRKDIAGSINRMLAALNLPPKEESLIATYVGNGVANLIRHSLGEGYEKLSGRALKIFKHDYDAHLLDYTRLYPDVSNVLEKLGAVPKAVITNKPLSFSEKILKGLSVRGHFNFVLGGDMAFPKKPAPESVLHLMKEARQSRKDKVLIVGDSCLDIQTGKNAGIKTCAVTYGFGARHELEAAKPDYVIDKFEGILEIIDK